LIASATRSLDLAVIIPSLDKYGGAERFVIECVSRWQHRHKVTLYAASFDEPLLEEHGIGTAVTRVRLSAPFEGQHAMLLNATLLPRLWRDEIGQHELYHTHLWPTHLVDRHPMVWYPHEPFRALHDLRYEQKHGGDGERQAHLYPKYDYDRFGERFFEPYLRAIAAADVSVAPARIVANSRYTAGYLSRVYNRNVTDIVYPGAEPARRIELPRDPNLFVTISQLWSHKRTRLLIEAISRLDEAQLIVIGSGPDREWLEDMSDKLGVADRVFFFSGLRNNELELILARACALLFAAVREPFGIVVLEAMAAGVPVIAVEEGGYAEVCTPDNAFLVPPLPADFAARMMQLQRDGELRNRMGAAGRATAAAYTWTRTAAELEQLLVETAAAAAPTPSAAPTLTGPLVGAQYYLWYGEGFGSAHWNDNPATGYVGDHPIAGYYGSTAGETITQHLKQAEAMGLDYLVLNLHMDENGPNTLESTAIDHMFAVAAARRSPVRLAVQLAPYADDPATLVSMIARIETSLSRHPNYLRLDGRPVLFWFWSAAFDKQSGVLDTIRDAQAFTHIASSLRLPVGSGERELTGGVFDGFAPYSPLELAEEDHREGVWDMGYRLAIESGMRWRVAAASPGYDDSALADPRRLGNPRRIISRRAGDTYRQALSWVERLDPAPHLVTISTFNEFHENTHIEPTTAHGNLYTDLTRDFVVRLRTAREAAR
jgi:glycosyltransferase involved in cell wall biosynthesis